MLCRGREIIARARLCASCFFSPCGNKSVQLAWYLAGLTVMLPEVMRTVVQAVRSATKDRESGWHPAELMSSRSCNARVSCPENATHSRTEFQSAVSAILPVWGSKFSSPAALSARTNCCLLNPCNSAFTQAHSRVYHCPLDATQRHDA